MSDKILVVDDETEIADLIEVYLKNENYTVFKCCLFPMEDIAGGKSSGAGAFPGEVLSQLFWLWLFADMHSHCLATRERLKIPKQTTQPQRWCLELAFWMKAHPKTRRQRMMILTGT